MKKPSEGLKDWVTIVSVAAIPILLGVGQLWLAHRDTNRQYVQLAMDILRNPSSAENKDGDRLRSWAVEIVNDAAPIELSDEAKDQLIEHGWLPPGWQPDGWQPDGWQPDGSLPEGAVPKDGGFSPKSFSPDAFSPEAFDMGLRRSTKEECQRNYSGDQQALEKCLAVASKGN